MKQEIKINNTADLERAAKEFLEKIGDRTLVAFFAPMGSGKTTFTTAICKVLGVTDPVGSPTFAIVNEYASKMGPIFHFDFYRIKNISGVIDVGFEDYAYSGCLCFMEWPQLIDEILPEETVQVYIAEQGDGSRIVRMG